MSVRIRTYRIWCLGLSDGDVECIRSHAGENHEIVVVSDAVLPTEADVKRDMPVLLWIGRDAWQRSRLPDGSRFLEYIPQVLLLPEDCSRDELLEALNGAFLDVVCGPLLEERVHDILARSLDVSNTYHDMERMTREILLNRELLSRKSEVLSFLLRFLRTVAGPQNRMDLLREVRQSLSELLPIDAMHAAFWMRQKDKTLKVDVHLDLSGRHAEQAWSGVLLDAISALVPVPENLFRVTTLVERLEPAAVWDDLPPGFERLLLLPLHAGDAPCGMVAVALAEPFPLSRDQALALDASMRHLAWIVVDTIHSVASYSHLTHDDQEHLAI